MKLKTIAFMCAAASLMAGSAFATDIYIQGSTAFRTAVTTAVEAAYDSGFTFATENASNEKKGNFVTYTGTMSGKGISASTVTVRCSWSGSVEGIQSYVGALGQQAFLPPPSGASTFSVATNTATAHAADFVLSDVFQDSTLNPTPVIPNDDIVGVVPFVWMRNGDTGGANITNITHQLANVLLPNGKLPLSLFSGNAADTANVLLIGRYPGSGTRLTTQAEVGYGANSTEVLYEFSTTNSYWYKVGNVGYSSGSSVANDLQKISLTGTPPTQHFKGPAVGYVGTGDGNTAKAGAAGTAAIYLSYDGVFPMNADGTTFNYTLVVNGQYTFWGYEHLLYNATGLSSVHNAFLTYFEGSTGVAAQLMPNVVTAGTAGIAASAMNVQRQDDGAVLGVGQHP